MKITFPYAYVANVSTAKVDDDRRAIVETFEVDVPEVSETDAPVVATWRETDALPRGGWTFERHPYIDMHVRHHEGRFYKMAGRRAGSDIVVTAGMLPPPGTVKFNGNPDVSAMYPSGGTDDHKAQSALYLWYGGRWGRQPTEGDITRRRKSDMAARAVSARELADGLVVVGGVVYQRVAEPKLVLVHDYATEWSARVVLGEAGFSGRFDRTDIGFGNDHIEILNLAEAGTALAGFTDGGPNSLRPYATDIRILDDRPFVFDSARNSLWRAAGAVVADLATDLRSMAPVDLTAWGKLRDFAEAREESLTETDFEAAMTHVEVLRLNLDPKNTVLADLFDALDRLWEAAPISGETAFALRP